MSNTPLLESKTKTKVFVRSFENFAEDAINVPGTIRQIKVLIQHNTNLIQMAIDLKSCFQNATCGNEPYHCVTKTLTSTREVLARMELTAKQSNSQIVEETARKQLGAIALSGYREFESTCLTAALPDDIHLLMGDERQTKIAEDFLRHDHLRILVLDLDLLREGAPEKNRWTCEETVQWIIDLRKAFRDLDQGSSNAIPMIQIFGKKFTHADYVRLVKVGAGVVDRSLPANKNLQEVGDWYESIKPKKVDPLSQEPRARKIEGADPSAFNQYPAGITKEDISQLLKERADRNSA